MDRPAGASLVSPVIATIAAIVLLSGGYLLSSRRLRELRYMSETPRATLLAPRLDGPAVYSGVVLGPEGRATARGSAAAATFFWVDRVQSQKSRRTVCYGGERRGMTLYAEGRVVPLAFVDAAQDVSILSVDRTWDWADPAVLDLGDTAREVQPGIPAVAASCRTDYPEYTERYVPRGARVEVLACYRDGALRACNGPRHGVLAVGGLAVHQRRTVEEALSYFVIAAGIALIVMGVLAGFAYAARDRSLEAMSGAGGGS